jgi:hypothetical protein
VTSSTERLFTLVLQHKEYDYGFTGHSGGLRHFEAQMLCGLTDLATLLNRRLVLAPPRFMLEPNHLSGDVSHGWDMLYDGEFDDPRFATWEALMNPGGGVSREVVNIDAKDPLHLMVTSTANLLVLLQTEQPGRADWDGATVLKLAARVPEKLRAIRMIPSDVLVKSPPGNYTCPPSFSRAIVAMGEVIRARLGPYSTVHVRRGDAVSKSKPVVYQGHAGDDLWESTSPAHVRDVLHEVGLTSRDTVLLFTNEANATFFDDLRTSFPALWFEDDLVNLVASGNVGFGDQYRETVARSPLSSSLFRMQMDTYLAQHGEKTVCTVSMKMNAKCDALLVKTQDKGKQRR